MNLLKKLTPAETCLILKGNETNFLDLLKLTFLDLVLKDIITISPSHQKLETLNNVQFERGKNFETFQIKTMKKFSQVFFLIFPIQMFP